MRSSKRPVNIESIREMEKIEKRENKAFNIDRKKEDTDVVRYQRTGDVAILEKLYKDRIPSLQFWTTRYYYLMDNSKEDMFGEFRNRFMRAIVYYNKKRGHFNTCLYTFIRNCIVNIIVGKQAKKRRPAGLEFDFNHAFLTSLDKQYENRDGSGSTLLDAVSNQLEDHNRAPDKMSFSETLNILSRNNPKIRGYTSQSG